MTRGAVPTPGHLTLKHPEAGTSNSGPVTYFGNISPYWR